MKLTILLTLILSLNISIYAQQKIYNFQPVEKNFLLKKIAKTKPGTWSLTKKTEKRYYGLTNSDLFNLFGNDRVGKIGTKSIFTADDKAGLNYTAIHALIKTVFEQNKQFEEINNRFNIMEQETMRINEDQVQTQNMLKDVDKIEKLETIVKDLEIRITELEKQLEEIHK